MNSKGTSAPFALLRALPLSYSPVYHLPHRPMSYELALLQHQAYAKALQKAGLRVHILPADEDWYDSVFVEDTAVVWGKSVLMTRMQAARSGEHGPVRDYLKQSHTIFELQNPASYLEGGDVLHAEDVTYVGLSGRTNEAGIEELKNFLKPFGREVKIVPTTKCLHLKTGATYLGENTLLMAPAYLSRSDFPGMDFIECAPGEENAANCIRIADKILILGNYKTTRQKLSPFASKHHLELIDLDTSEFEKGDGSLTCLSIIY